MKQWLAHYGWAIECRIREQLRKLEAHLRLLTHRLPNCQQCGVVMDVDAFRWGWRVCMACDQVLAYYYHDEYLDDEDYYEWRREDDWELALDECGQLENGLCLSAGSEYCDFECPFRDWSEDDAEEVE